MSKRSLPEKLCAACGRRFSWRRRWARDWESVRYCSDACRGSRGDDAGIESRILALVGARADGSICPSEVARALEPETWRDLMEPVRRAARRLAARGVIVVTQSGRVIDPTTMRGPVRLRLAPGTKR